MSDRGATSTTKLSAAHAKRLSWALKDDGGMLAAAVGKDTSPEARKVERLPVAQIPEHLARLILERADPTTAKSMTAWLVRQYGEGKLRLEDLGSAHETLEMFQRYAPKLPEGHRDLGRYQSLAAVWDAIIGFAQAEEQHISGKAQKALDRDKAYAESRILRQDPDGFTITVPLTEFAAKWWGRGSRWCTAGEKDNQFWHYHKDAPLVVVVLPWLGERGKFQFWSTKNDAQFMDAADEPITNETLIQNWDRFGGVLLHALRLNVGVLKYIPEALRTEELCKVAAHHDGLALEYVPKPLRTDEMCKISVTQDGRALRHVPQKLRSEELRRVAIAQNGLALEYVPKPLRTDEMCRIAVARVGRALRDVPEDLRTEEMCRIAVAQDGRALEYAPKNLRTKLMCRIAVAQNGFALAYVPWRLRTVEMCRIAVASEGRALHFVPKDLRKEEIYRIAVAQNGEALYLMPLDLRTEKLCRIAVEQNGEALRYVPQKLCTEDLCRLAVAQDGRALYWVPQKLRTEEMCRIAVAQNGWALQYVPEALRDRISALIPPPIPAWDISVLDDLVSLLGTTSSPARLETPHA